MLKSLLGIMMRHAKRNIFICANLCTFVASLSLPGCEEFAENPNHPRPTRAVQSPVGLSSPNSEVMGRPQGAVPLVTVDLPNKKDDPVVVHTIADRLPDLSAPGGATTRRATTEPAPAENAAILVVQKKNPGDRLIVTGGGEGDAKASITVICANGIGTAVLQRTGESWPATITVHFSYGDRPFTRLEGLTVSEITASGTRVAIKTETAKDGESATINVHAFVRSREIVLEWVDTYR